MSKYTPSKLKAPHGARSTEITWADGLHCVYPNKLLRSFCPCGTCQGHHGPIRRIDGGNTELRQIEPVGSYALKLVWGDGHDTGIYTFRHLRDLGAEPEVLCTGGVQS